MSFFFERYRPFVCWNRRFRGSYVVRLDVLAQTVNDAAAPNVKDFLIYTKAKRRCWILKYPAVEDNEDRIGSWISPPDNRRGADDWHI